MSLLHHDQLWAVALSYGRTANTGCDSGQSEIIEATGQ